MTGIVWLLLGGLPLKFWEVAPPRVLRAVSSRRNVARDRCMTPTLERTGGPASGDARLLQPIAHDLTFVARSLLGTMMRASEMASCANEENEAERDIHDLPVSDAWAGCRSHA